MEWVGPNDRWRPSGARKIRGDRGRSRGEAAQPPITFRTPWQNAYIDDTPHHDWHGRLRRLRRRLVHRHGAADVSSGSHGGGRDPGRRQQPAFAQRRGGRVHPAVDRQRTASRRKPRGRPRRVFAEAQGEIVLCIDSHILIEAQAIQRLLEFAMSGRSATTCCGVRWQYDDLHTLLRTWTTVASVHVGRLGRRRRSARRTGGERAIRRRPTRMSSRSRRGRPSKSPMARLPQIGVAGLSSGISRLAARNFTPREISPAATSSACHFCDGRIAQRPRGVPNNWPSSTACETTWSD